MNRLRLLCFVSVLALSAGCSSNPEPKPATAVEEEFKQRWLARRINELTQSGADTREARRQAAEEFKQRYEYTNAAQKTDPVNGGALP
jgi:hypothetical protein